MQQAEQGAGRRRHQHRGPEIAALVDPEPGDQGALGHDALDAEVEHAGALADEFAEGAEDERRRHAHQRGPEAEGNENFQDIHRRAP